MPLLLSLSFLAVGCSVGRVECAVFSDCGAGQECGAEGKCVEVSKADCHTDADCEGERFCTRRGCVLGPVCEAASDCGAGYLCDRHECLADSCTADTDCVVGSCVSGRCQECAGDSDCAGQAFCEQGLCVPPECQSDSACAAGQECIAARCRTTVPDGQRYRVQEQAEVHIALPEASSVTAPGESELGTLRVDTEGLLFSSTGCVAGEALIETSLRLADGTADQLSSVVEVVDSEAPVAPELTLTDLPAAEQVEVSFILPAENSRGSCPTRRFEFVWSVDERSEHEEVLELEEAEVGQLVRYRLEVPTGQELSVKLRAVDEAGNATEVEARQALIRPIVWNFWLSDSPLPPGDFVSVNYDVGRATQVELFRDGVSVEGSPRASEGEGSWRLPVGFTDSTFELQLYDEIGNRHVHSRRLNLRVDASLEVEPNETPAAATTIETRAAGSLSGTGDVDVFRIHNDVGGAHFALSTEELQGSCQSNISLEFLARDQQTVLWSASGACPGTAGAEQNNLNLGRGWHYLRVRSNAGAQRYSIAVRQVQPACGDGIGQTNADEPCDGTPYCTAQCTPSIVIPFTARPELRSAQIQNRQWIRLDLTMPQDGWIDVGTGDYTNNTCGANSIIVREQEHGCFRIGEGVEEGGPGHCGRMIQQIPAGHYYIRISIHDGAHNFRVNYTAYANP